MTRFFNGNWIPAFAGTTVIFAGMAAMILGYALPAFADTQFNASVTPNSGPIGSQFTYTVTAVSEMPIIQKSVQFRPKWSPMVVVKQDYQSQQSNGNHIGIWTVTLTHFETKPLVIPAQTIQLNPTAAPQTLPEFKIGYQAPTGNAKLAFQPAPLRKLPVPWLAIIGLLGLAAALIAGLYWLIQKYRNREIADAVSAPEQPRSIDPEGDAWAAIAQLPLTLPDDGQDHLYSTISDILRTYLGAKFDTHLFERTTTEILSIVAPYLDEQGLRRVRHVLRDCDIVKFGKRRPTPEDYSQTIERLKQIIVKLGAGHGTQ